MAQILKLNMMMYLQLQNDWSHLGCHDAAVTHHKSIHWKWKALFWGKKHISRQFLLEVSVSTTNFMCMLMLQCLPSSNVGHKITKIPLLILIQYNIGRQRKDSSLNICHVTNMHSCSLYNVVSGSSTIDTDAGAGRSDIYEPLLGEGQLLPISNSQHHKQGQ